MTKWITLYKPTAKKPTIIKISRNNKEKFYSNPTGSSLKRIVILLNEGNTNTYKNAWSLEYKGK